VLLLRRNRSRVRHAKFSTPAEGSFEFVADITPLSQSLFSSVQSLQNQQVFTWYFLDICLFPKIISTEWATNSYFLKLGFLDVSGQTDSF